MWFHRGGYIICLFLLILIAVSLSEDSCLHVDSESCILERLDSEEKLREEFNADPVSYQTYPEYLVPSIPPYERDVTLCTQGSIDRLDRLLEQAKAWRGSVSAALYLKPTDVEKSSKPETLARIKRLHDEVESMGRCRLTISLLYGLSPLNTESEYDSLYVF